MKMKQSKAIQDKLMNDRTSSHEELLDYFVNVISISEKSAKEYLATRHVYLNHPAFNPKKIEV